MSEFLDTTERTMFLKTMADPTQMRLLRHAYLLIAVMVASPILSVSVQAQSDGRKPSLEQRLEELEKWKAEQEKNPVKALMENQKLGLLLQIKAFHDEAAGVSSAFKGRRAEIKLSGSVLPDKVSYAVMVDPFLAGNITKDANITFSYIPHADVQFGQFKFPQGLEGRWSSGDLDFIERAVVSGTFGDKRDIGAQVTGTKLKWKEVRMEYGVGVFNGAGQSAAENNEDKDIAGRLGAEWRGLWAGASGYSGRQPLGYRSRFGGELRYVLGGAKIQAEYLTGKTERAAKSPARQQGYYVSANYVMKQFRPGLRWESWNPDLDAPGSRQDALTTGLDYILTVDRRNKVSLNFTKRLEGGASVANDEWALQAQAAF